MVAFFALVGQVAKPTIHTLNGEALPHPDVVIIETSADGIFLFRHTIDGQFGGDTWHETIEEAMSQAEFEYGDALGRWVEIPGDVPSAVGYALRVAVDARNESG